MVSVRSTLGELTTNQGKAAWTPTTPQLEKIFKQKQFVNLSGETQAKGDLKSVVLHQMDVRNVSSTFPIALGAKISGVEEKYFSSIGDAYSMIVLPNHKSDAVTTLQKDDVSIGERTPMLCIPSTISPPI